MDHLMPGPGPVPIVGWRAHLLSMARDPIAHMTDLHDKYGPICAWNPPDPRYVFVFSAEYNQELFGKPDLFHSNPTRDLPMPKDSAMARISSGLLCLNGPRHRQQRQLIAPSFHRRHIEAQCDSITRITALLLSRWEGKAQIDVEADMKVLIQRIAMKTVFGLDSNNGADELSALIGQLISLATGLSARLFPFDLPGSHYRKMIRTADQIEKMLLDIIAQKRTYPPEFPDMLSLLIAAHDGEGGALTEAELIAESYTILCQDTTATALSWTILLLAQHPRTIARLLEEVESVVGNEFPTVEKMMNMPFMDQVIKESMRILPPSGFGFRYTADACNLGPYPLPKDATIFFSQYVLHRRAELFADPNRFLPERWSSIKPGPCEFIPFGTGVHSCLGLHFALAEMKIILTMMLQRFSLEVVPGTKIDRAYSTTMFPKHGLPMLIHPRGRKPVRSPISGNVLQMVDFD